MMASASGLCCRALRSEQAFAARSSPQARFAWAQSDDREMLVSLTRTGLAAHDGSWQARLSVTSGSWTGSARRRWPALLTQIERLTVRAADMLAAETDLLSAIPGSTSGRRRTAMAKSSSPDIRRKAALKSWACKRPWAFRTLMGWLQVREVRKSVLNHEFALWPSHSTRRGCCDGGEGLAWSIRNSPGVRGRRPTFLAQVELGSRAFRRALGTSHTRQDSLSCALCCAALSHGIIPNNESADSP